MVCFSFWQPNRDSNPNIQSQSLLCYRYTIRLSAFADYIIATVFLFVNSFFKKNEKYSFFFGSFFQRKKKALRRDAEQTCIIRKT